MKQPKHINKHIPEESVLNFAYLRKEGIRLAQKLAGDIWTDYNEHDPGVTILEQLCFALTDLGYRMDFDIEQLLSSRRSANKAIVPGAFFNVHDILPVSPWTINDYRILILDQLPEIKNVWVVPVRDNAQGINGLYDFKLQLNEKLEEQEKEEVKQKVKNIYCKNRNLCEDINEVQILEATVITIRAEIDIDNESIAEAILAQLFYALEENLIPRVKMYSYRELIEEGIDFGEIFDGPLTQNGVLKPDELKPLLTEIYISDLIEIVSGIKGVRAIRNFEVFKDDIPVEGDVITLEANRYPVLDNDFEEYMEELTEYPIQFFRGWMPVLVSLSMASKMLQEHLHSNAKHFKISRR